MKNYKTCYEDQIESSIKKIIQASPNPQPTPHRIKSYVFGIKFFLRRYTEMYIHLLSKCFKNAVLGRQEMVQCKMFFSDSKQKYVCWKICKIRKTFDCVRRAYYFIK